MVGELVRSTAGHDKGQLFCVVAGDGCWLMLADGKRRRQAAPKRKKVRHTEALGCFEHPVLERLSRAEAVTDNEIRKAIAAFRAQSRRV